MNPFKKKSFLGILICTCSLNLFAQHSCDDWPFDRTTVPVADLILTPTDTVLCGQATVRLRTSTVQAFCWSPTIYLDDPLSPTPIASPPIQTTYFFTSKTIGSNLIVNGNFSLGNTAFISAYTYGDIGFAEGIYTVDNSPAPYWDNAPKCSDHSTGTGNMMLVNGAGVPNVNVWTQHINIAPGTLYEFSCWVENISRTTENLCSLQFSINDVPIGPVFHSEANSCIWKQFFANWNSGNSTTAKISIVNQSSAIEGNDFALDDISFAPVSYKQDSVRILRNNNCTTPLHIKSFDVAKKGQDIILQLETFKEEETASIEIERAFDNSPFSFLNKMQLKGDGHYQYTDNIVPKSTDRVYYRIKDINKNGKIFFSEVKSVAIAKSQIYLVNDKPIKQLNELLIFSSANNKNITISVVDAAGRIYYNKNIDLAKGFNKIMTSNVVLVKGLYFVNFASSKEKTCARIVVN